MTEQNQYDDFMAALSKAGVIYTELDKPEQVFERLGVPVPDEPAAFLSKLVSTGELDIEREKDDPEGRGSKFCHAYRPI